MSLLSDIRFGSRSAAFAAYIFGTLARHEVLMRVTDVPDEERVIADTMLRFGRRMSRLFGIEVVTSDTGRTRATADPRRATL